MLLLMRFWHGLKLKLLKRPAQNVTSIQDKNPVGWFKVILYRPNFYVITKLTRMPHGLYFALAQYLRTT